MEIFTGHIGQIVHRTDRSHVQKLAISLKKRVTCAQQQLPEGWTFENQKLCRDRPWNLWQHCCQ
jgi:hypothetical protein